MVWFVAAAMAADPCDGIDNDGNGVIDDPAASIGALEFASVADAVAAAPDGALVNICSTRSHAEDLVLGERSITLAGVGPFGPATLSGSQQVTGSEHVTFRHLHLVRPPDPGLPGTPALLVGEKGWVDVDDVTVDTADPGVEVWGDLHATASHFSTAPLSSTTTAAVVVQPGGTASLGTSDVSDSQVGVLMRGGLLAGGAIRENDNGVLVLDAVAVIAGSTIAKNRFDGIDAVASDLTLNEVTVTQNEGTGVFLFADDGIDGLVSRASIAYSLIEKNRRTGLRTEVPLDLLDTLVTDNTGGGIVTWADLAAASSSVTGNVAQRGAGVLVLDAVTVTGLRIAGNSAVQEGGGLLVDTAEGVTVLDHVLITDNSAGALGGGLVVFGEAQIADSAVHRNTAPSAGGALVGSDKGHSLSSRCSSWGIRTDDNTVDDVLTDAGAWSIGTDDFRCDAGGCVLSAALCGDPGGDVLDGWRER